MELQHYIGKIGVMAPKVGEAWSDTGVPSLLRVMQIKRMFLDSRLGKLFLYLKNVHRLCYVIPFVIACPQRQSLNAVIAVKAQSPRHLHLQKWKQSKY